jgi:D-glycero-D-manno-heptose 1,7-bisphosphate phosphatase
VTELAGFKLLPGAVEGMAELAGCGYELIVVSNQRGIARGIVGEEILHTTEKVLQRALEPLGARISGFYYCPHESDENCDCRKPRPGMLLRAARERGLDLEASWMAGDSMSDIEAGTAAGCRTVAIGPDASGATLSAASLGEAAGLICGADHGA